MLQPLRCMNNKGEQLMGGGGSVVVGLDDESPQNMRRCYAFIRLCFAALLRLGSRLLNWY